MFSLTVSGRATTVSMVGGSRSAVFGLISALFSISAQAPMPLRARSTDGRRNFRVEAIGFRDTAWFRRGTRGPGSEEPVFGPVCFEYRSNSGHETRFFQSRASYSPSQRQIETDPVVEQLPFDREMSALCV